MRSPGRRRARNNAEEILHRAVAAFLRLACPVGGEVFWAHTPNGGKRHIAEASRLKEMGTVAGIPDLMIVCRGRAHWIELKPPGKYPSVAQREVRERLFNAGCDHWSVCRSVDEVEAKLREWAIPLRASLGGAVAQGPEDRHQHAVSRRTG